MAECDTCRCEINENNRVVNVNFTENKNCKDCFDTLTNDEFKQNINDLKEEYELEAEIKHKQVPLRNEQASDHFAIRIAQALQRNDEQQCRLAIEEAHMWVTVYGAQPCPVHEMIDNWYDFVYEVRVRDLCGEEAADKVDYIFNWLHASRSYRFFRGHLPVPTLHEDGWNHYGARMALAIEQKNSDEVAQLVNNLETWHRDHPNAPHRMNNLWYGVHPFFVNVLCGKEIADRLDKLIKVGRGIDGRDGEESDGDDDGDGDNEDGDNEDGANGDGANGDGDNDDGANGDGDNGDGDNDDGANGYGANDADYNEAAERSDAADDRNKMDLS